MKYIVLALGALLVYQHPAKADEMVLSKSAEPFARNYQGHSTDILGIKPGMTVEETTKILTKEYGADPVAEHQNIGLTFKSISMSSQQYVSQLTSQKQDDRIVVVFGTPATGNTVVGIQRTLTFPDALTAPKQEAIYSQLNTKYGTPSQSKPRTFVGNLWFESWAFNAHDSVKCLNDLCPTPYSMFNPSELNSYQQSMASGKHLLIQANLFLLDADPSRIRQLDITIDDQANKALSGQEALKQLQAAASAAYDKKAKPQDAPKL